MLLEGSGGEKEIKEGDRGHVCGGEWSGGEWNERIKNNIKIKNPNWEILPQYFHNIFTINFK